MPPTAPSPTVSEQNATDLAANSAMVVEWLGELEGDESTQDNPAPVPVPSIALKTHTPNLPENGAIRIVVKELRDMDKQCRAFIKQQLDAVEASFVEWEQNKSPSTA